jgi:hydrogenase maturation protein HypF
MVHLAEITDEVAGHLQLRLRVVIRGAVQGVGFRPYVYRIATDLGLQGWVINSSQGVFIEVEGKRDLLDVFLLRLEREKPPLSYIRGLEYSFLDHKGYKGFEVRESDDSGAKTVLVIPDIATCPDCLAEISDPSNRRYLYPFTNCTNCGPRYSIIERLPYDRSYTTMKDFEMCDECREEYENPSDRRFHAQPNACSECGPHVELWDRHGDVIALHHDALLHVVDAIRHGMIVALKGLGGFHLMVDAQNCEAVYELRTRKHREEKPLAVMYPSITSLKEICDISDLEERLLTSPESPIVLLRRKPESLEIAINIAPGNPYLGVMLPYTPLHHILMAELGFPLVATSGNRSDEPICTDEHEALERLGGIADIFLVHNRPIKRHVDDSIARVMMGRELVLRRARGYAPLPIHLKGPVPPLMAVGAHLKNTIAASVDDEVFISQHIGDLDTVQAVDAFKQVYRSLQTLYDLKPSMMVCDLHPDYTSTQFAKDSGLPVFGVQHHYAHILSCMAENELEPPVLGVSWDGTGYGLDGSIWGGEFLQVDGDSFQRAAHLRTFRLPGGDMAVREPRRAALGLLYELYGESLFEMTDLIPIRAFSSNELGLLQNMLAKGINSPMTSSAGRLFDAVASITGLRQITRFEGQAAMELEFALEDFEADESYHLEIIEPTGSEAETSAVVDWATMIEEIINDIRQGIPTGLISGKFHNALAEAIVAVAGYFNEERVVMSGGCFQNRYLAERSIHLLREEGRQPYWHQRIPPNDGGIALGQIIAASRESAKE